MWTSSTFILKTFWNYLFSSSINFWRKVEIQMSSLKERMQKTGCVLTLVRKTQRHILQSRQCSCKWLFFAGRIHLTPPFSLHIFRGYGCSLYATRNQRSVWTGETLDSSQLWWTAEKHSCWDITRRFYLRWRSHKVTVHNKLSRLFRLYYVFVTLDASFPIPLTRNKLKFCMWQLWCRSICLIISMNNVHLFIILFGH